MIRITCRVEDFLTQEPISGCTVEPTVFVAPTVFGPIPDMSAAVGIRRSAVTGPDGLLNFDFDVGGEFRRLERLKEQGEIAGAPVSVIQIRTACDHLDRTRPLKGTFGEDEVIEQVFALDFAKSIVGHTTPDSTVLWFCLHAERQDGDPYVCEIDNEQSASGPEPLQSHQTIFDKGANTCILRIRTLQPRTRYTYTLRYQGPEQAGKSREGRVLTVGEFFTFSDERDSRELNFAFVSCHMPVHHRALSAGSTVPAAREALERLAELGALRPSRYDMLLMLGDQIYADGIDRNFPDDIWFTRYAKRYHQVWEYRDLRKAFASRATYMILDDHEIKDDFGTVATDDERVTQGLNAYRAFQHCHNPGGPDGPFYYHFRRGPAAFYVLDARTRRTPNAESVEFPVLGRSQLNDLREWAHSDEAQTADVIFLVSSVPLAWLPVETIRRAAEEAGPEGGLKAGLIVGGIGSLFGGGPGLPLVFGALGYVFGDDIAESAFDYKKNDPDIEDHWTFGPNQNELQVILTLLFDLANDLDPSTGETHQPARRRAVFILGGDVHMGAIHVIRSNQDAQRGLRDHRANPVIYGLTSSPVSHEPDDNPVYVPIIQHIRDDLKLDLAGSIRIDLSERGLDRIFDVDKFLSSFGHERAKFVLDTEGQKVYGAELVGLVPQQRNYGVFSMRRVPGSRRRYEFSFSIEGPVVRMMDEFTLDLDSRSVVPRAVLSVRNGARRARRSGAVSVRGDLLGFPGVPAGGSVHAALEVIFQATRPS